MLHQFLLSLNIKTDTCIMGIHRNAFPAPCQFYIPRPCFTPTKGQARKKCSIPEVEFIYYIIVAPSLIFLLTTQNLCSLLNKFAQFLKYLLIAKKVAHCHELFHFQIVKGKGRSLPRFYQCGVMSEILFSLKKYYMAGCILKLPVQHTC